MIKVGFFVWCRVLVAGILLLGSWLVNAQVSFGDAQLINDNWRFKQEDVKEGQAATLNDSRWQRINVPHDWSVKGRLNPSLASATGFLPGGIGWYRKVLHVPAADQDKRQYLYFEGVYNRSEVYINGKLLGKRPNGYISFMYDVTPYLEYGKDNVIAVKVDHSQSADSRWYTGSGIYRNVWLVKANPVHFEQWSVFAYPKNVTAKEATLQVDAVIENHAKENAVVNVAYELIDAAGKIVAKTSKKATVQPGSKEALGITLKVKNPQLWSLENPYLYKLKTRILQQGKQVDETTVSTGFRSYTFDPDKGFALNGEWMKMKGVCLHHDAGVLGAAVYKEVWKRRLLTLKSIGVNAIRTSHNPQATSLYELCDELGLLVMNEAFDEWEFPKRKWLEGWNVGTPGFEGTFDFFEEWGEQDLADMVRRDRNHISIFAWSIGNEVDYPNDPYSHPVLAGNTGGGFTQPIFGGYKKDAPDAMRLGGIAKRLVAVVKKYDTSRPTTAGLAGVAMSNETEYPAALDIAGYNYTEGKYAEDHKTYPKRVIYGSENRHEIGAWKAVRDNEYIFGQFLWTGIDYLGESGRWPSRGFYSGLLDFGGFIKPRGYYRQSLWTSTPMVYIGSYPTPGKGGQSQMQDVWSQLDAQNAGNYEEKVPSMDAWPIWNYEEGQSIRVVTYTNAAKAQLLLNGKVLGEKKEYNDNTGIIFWDIPYQAGVLEVVGFDKADKEIVRHSIRSSKTAYALKVTQIDNAVAAAKGLAQVVVEIVDADGNKVLLGDNEITCDIQGPGTLLGLEGSNNSDMTDYTDNTHRAYRGRILAYVQANGKPGEKINIRFTSPLLKTVTTSLTLN